MIAPNLMYLDHLRSSWKRSIVITVGCALTSAIVIAWETNWGRLPQLILYQSIMAVDEVSNGFGGGMIVRLKDGKRTELQIARDRLREVRARLDF